MEESDYPQEGRGRSAKKRAAKAVEELAARLVELPEPELATLPLAAEVRKELDLARSTRGHSSRRRQLKHFAAVLRREEEQREAIEAFFDGFEVTQARSRASFHQLEDLRDRLCDPTTCDAALTEVGAELPTVDVKKLANLARAVHASGDKKAAREIFRRLRQGQEAVASP